MLARLACVPSHCEGERRKGYCTTLESKECQYDETLDLSTLVAPLLSRWKLLLLFLLLGCAVGFTATRFVPKTYQSTAVIFAKQSRSSDLMRSLPIPLISSSGGTSGYFTAILQSQTCLRRVITRLDLPNNPVFTRGKKMTTDEVIKRLEKTVDVKDNKSGSTNIAVKAWSPRLAADIANAMVETLGGLVVRTSKRKADFIAARLDETTRDLRNAEDEMQHFAEKTDVASIDEQTKDMVRELGELDGRLVSLDVELEEVSSRLSNSGELESLVDLEVRKKAIESSRSVVSAKRAELQDKLESIPGVAANYGRIQRKIMVLSSTFEILTQQYQMERITQQGEDGDYQIIDRARPNMKKVAPRTMVSIASGGMLGMVLGAFVASAGAGRRKYKKGR